jgi:hypothetical protein
MKARLGTLAINVASRTAPITTAQLKSCGDLELFIANPDLRGVAADGKYLVAGDSYMQFQAQGDGVRDIETFAFSVGLPPENPE